MRDLNFGLIIQGDSRDARREIGTVRRDFRELERDTERLGRASQNYGRRAVQANRQVARSTRDVGRQVTSLKGLIGGLTVAYVALRGLRAAVDLAGQFKDAAREAEGYRVRLNTLLGSVYEGNRAFEEMAQFASTVPFEYREIMGAATQLAGVLEGGVDEIKQYIPVIADLAAVSGLSIEETTSQVIRMYSAGAASADLFRERGILAMLDFQAGVSYSADETRKKLIAAWEDPASKFRGATQDLARNWDGIMSMISDSWFKFRDRMTEDTVLWDFLKTSLDEFRMWWADALDWNQSEFDAWAEGIITTIKYLGVAFTTLWDVVAAPKRIFDALLALGDTMNSAVLYPLNAIGAVSDETYKEFQRRAEASRNSVARLNQTTSDFLAKFEEIEQKARHAFELRQVNVEIEKMIANNEELFGSQKRVTKAIQETGDVGKDTMDKLNKDIEQLIKNDDLFAMGWKDNLEKRFADTEKSLRTELEALEANRREQLEVIDAAERQGLKSTMSYAELRRRVEEDYQDKRAQLEQQGADRMEKIWSNAIENMQRAFGDTIYNALWEDGIDSFGDFADALLDIWKRMIAEMIAAWVTSGIAGLLAGEGFSGFSFGGFGGGNILTTAGSAAAKKYFPSLVGPSTTSGAGGGATAAAATGGAQTFALEGGGTVTAIPIASAGPGGATGSLGTSLHGGAQFTTAGGAEGAGGLGAAGSAAVLAAYVYAGSQIIQGLKGPSEKARAIREFGKIGGFSGVGPLGLQTAAGPARGFFGGPNAGFVSEFARAGGNRPTQIGDNAFAFKGFDLDQLNKTLADAQHAFEELKQSAADALGTGKEGAKEMGAILQDGVVDRTELARIGFQNLGTAIHDDRTGVTELGVVFGNQFKAITDAIRQGDVRLKALRGEVKLNQKETEFLGRLGLEFGESFSQSSLDARIQLQRLRDSGVDYFGDIANAANAAASAAASIGRSSKDIEASGTFKPSSTSSPSGGSSSVPIPRGPGEGKARGGIASGPAGGYWELLHGTEGVIPLENGDRLRAPVQIQGGMFDPETKSLLRSIESRLAQLQTTSLDERSAQAIAAAITGPMRAQERSRALRERARR